jgi:hypothetical protein
VGHHHRAQWCAPAEAQVNWRRHIGFMLLAALLFGIVILIVLGVGTGTGA